MPPRSPLLRALVVVPIAALIAGMTTACAAAPQAAPPAATPHRIAAAPGVTRVLFISVDGLNPRAITRLGRSRAPSFYRLMDEGASTLNARTEREQTETLPNHTGMVTSRRIEAARGGHGVTWNDERLTPRTVQEAAGHPVSSVFSRVHGAGGTSAVFVSKRKLSLFKRSWPKAVNRSVVLPPNGKLVTTTRRDLLHHQRMLTFLHLSLPDAIGHASGWMGPEYLDAVSKTDARVGRLLRTVDQRRALRRHLAVVVTADHGGIGLRHYDATKLANYRIPFFIWGPGVDAGADLYDLNPDYANPHKKRPRYGAARQPVRNGDVANLVTHLLGLKPVAGSELDSGQNLNWSAP